MATHVLKYGVAGSAVDLRNDVSNTQAGVSLIDGEEVATAETDYQLDFDLDVSLCKSFYLVSDQDVLFETNAIDATGGNAISLLANVPYQWHITAYDSFLLTLDVTTVYVTNVSGETATISAIALYDAVVV